MSKQTHNHLQELLSLLGGLDTDGPGYRLHKEIIRLGNAVAHDLEAGQS